MDFERFRLIADSVGALLLADISHPSGLIAKGLLNDPLPHLPYCDNYYPQTLRGRRTNHDGEDFVNQWD
jgi:glycine hydroxymethyltransferase